MRKIFILLFILTAASCGFKKRGESLRDILSQENKYKTPEDIYGSFEKRIASNTGLEVSDDNKGVTIDEAINKMEERKGTYSVVSPGTAAVKDFDSDLGISDIKELIRKGKYSRVLDSKRKTGNEYKYYYAICHYCLAKTSSVRKTKADHAAKAVSLFREAGVSSQETGLKARSVLWHGITQLVFYPQLSAAELQKPFAYIQGNLKTSRCYNDSLLYSALTARKKKIPAEADQFLSMLNQTSPKDLVYDEMYRKWVTPQSAARHYGAKISAAEPAPSEDEKIKEEIKQKLDEKKNEIKNNAADKKETAGAEAVKAAPAAEKPAEKTEAQSLSGGGETLGGELLGGDNSLGGGTGNTGGDLLGGENKPGGGTAGGDSLLE